MEGSFVAELSVLFSLLPYALSCLCPSFPWFIHNLVLVSAFYPLSPHCLLDIVIFYVHKGIVFLFFVYNMCTEIWVLTWPVKHETQEL
jgi:hypothetical protein